MAEALLPLIGGEHFEVCSAGTHPVGLNPAAIEAMREVGVDISQHRSKHVNEFLTQQFDYVITVCDRAKESCPVFPGTSRLVHWSFADPAGAQTAQRKEVFTRVRDEIADTICQFIVEEKLLPAGMMNCYRCGP
jgi:arsenate reductase